ncbi:MAG: polysaccharide biosynthesis tyrosine autokinase [Candidatus Saccharicenans sp.]|jgi:capsular exopolysaccharide synthesis family protein|nr:polysaccharide biosynthesis tyrosine autokinase [Candidatus Saccharicenans sp.]MDH7574907.1 polysaccharide biosynthesis tyrosine autokinase [Candidatus Saccharicenans sp.]
MSNENYVEPQALEAGEIDLRKYLDIILRRRWTVISITLIAAALSLIISFVTRPVYKARGTVMIEKEPNILSFEDIFQIETFRDDYFQTQYKLLQSRSLAERTIERLKLWEKKEFSGSKSPTADDLKNPVFRQKMVDKFLGRLEVKPIRMTRLVEVAFKAHDPTLASDCVNALFDSFVDMNIEAKYETTEQATEFLSGQIEELKKEISQKEQELQNYGQEKDIVILSDKETTMLDKISELNKALTEAQIDRVRKESYYNGIKNASPDFIPEAMNNPLIQRLREDYLKLSREYAKMQEKFQPEYPEMQRLKAELDSARELLKNETQRLIKAAYADYQAALKKEISLKELFEQQKEEAFRLNSSAILYNSLKIELENKKNLLESLLKRQSETGVSARLKGLRTSNIRIVDRADLPLRPDSPRKFRNLLLALFLGLFGGLGLALVMEYLDNTVKSAEDIERYSGLPTLGVVPVFDEDATLNGHYYAYRSGEEEEEGSKKKKKERDKAAAENGGEPRSIELISHFAPDSTFAESYRSLRTALLLSGPLASLKSLIITSPLPNEGKSVTISNLAVSLAQMEKKVLLMDADLRRPKQHRIFNLKNHDGLSNYLTMGLELNKLIKTTLVPSLYFINSGPVPPNPAELLGSDRMKALLDRLKAAFDFILIDTPPILSVTDAQVLGKMVDGLVLVVQADRTPREALKQTREVIDLLQLKTYGVVINALNLDNRGYYRRQYYRHYYQK